MEPGQEIEINERDGRIEIEPVMGAMALVEREGFLAAEVSDDDGAPLTADQVRALLDRARR